MKSKTKLRILALSLCSALLVPCLPVPAFAAEEETELNMTEGDVRAGFAAAGSEFTSSDPSVAWVDANGDLNALKPGTVTVSDGQTDYTVNVGDYSDGSEIAGNLKILARYNDSMQFYDGHVYLLFTSYQDGVDISVPDLYAGYEISDQYYTDIREDISNGSNHTGTDTDKYFTFSDDMHSVTVDRGEIVTIGMYRDFDLSVPQAALGSIKNSSGWTELKASGKTAVVETIFKFLNTGDISTDEAVEKIKAVCAEIGMDYTKLLDGVVDGGVCFNRELYNQKLEWDQFENVTYEMDITRNQLNTLVMYLGGNLNKFSILKNSCATVALRAWNAAVGTRNGENTAYHLSSDGEGIFSLIDAPKSVRDNIVERLPGYYLNNSEGVAEPDAGYQDETGWVYVSAPEKVSPVSYVYDDPAVTVDESKTKMASLINPAKAGSGIAYSKDEQEIGVAVRVSEQEQSAAVEGLDFTVNGETVSLGGENMPETGIWFKIGSDEQKYVVDAEGRAVPSEYKNGYVSFFADSLPFTFRLEAAGEDSKNVLETVVVNGGAEVYYKDGEEKVLLDAAAEVKPGTKLFVKPLVAEGDIEHVPSDIRMNGESVFSAESYDSGEDAYFTVMPENYSTLLITFDTAVLRAKGNSVIQASVNDIIDVHDHAELFIGASETASDAVVWREVLNDGVVECDGAALKVLKEGEALVWASAEDNVNIGVLFSVKAYESTEDMVKITYNDSTAENVSITAKYGDESPSYVAFPGYLVKKGSVLEIVPKNQDASAILRVTANGANAKAGDTITVTRDTEISVTFASAEISGMPKTVSLAEKGDTYQLPAKTNYKGAYRFLRVYDASIRYVSSDPIVSVDENGLITVADEVPEGGRLVIVTAYAGSSNNKVFAQTKVIVGDYDGTKTVGRMTISARTIHKGELVAHGALTFTSYEDLDLGVSFFHYYRPNDKYNDLMIDYEENPEKYTSDPALYTMNELGLEDRESYFDTYSNGAESDPQTISLMAGETFTVSNYGYDATNILTIMRAIEGSQIYSSKDAQILVEQMKKYTQGEEIDGAETFDSLVATLTQIYAINKATGQNPANGHSDGGMDLNREIFNQFRRNDSQMPNNYYTIEITADELAKMKQYLCDPNNNFYSFMAKNCATGVVDIWNTTLFDKPELHLTANMTGLAVDPQSLYFELGALSMNPLLDGEGGQDFYPRTIRYSEAVRTAIEKIKAIGKVEYTDECKSRIDEARAAYDALADNVKERVWNAKALSDAEEEYEKLKKEAGEDEDDVILGDINGDGKIDISDATLVQQAAAEAVELSEAQLKAADVNGDGKVDVADATLVQMYAAEIIDHFGE